jgi:hypothetical protein
MTKKALVVNNTAADVEADAETVVANYHPDVAAMFVDVPDAVVKGSTLSGSTWSPPPVIPPAPITYGTMSGVIFYNCFTIQERIDIKAAVDPRLVELLATLQLAISSGTVIDPNLPTISEGLELMTTIVVPGSTPTRNYLSAGRPVQIQSGILQ